jgi:hypothetical protein
MSLKKIIMTCHNKDKNSGKIYNVIDGWQNKEYHPQQENNV